MDTQTQAIFEARAGIIKALAHPTRLFIVDELSRGEKCVRDLTDMIGADVSTVSKHLSILKGAGMVSDRKQGLKVFYELKTPCVLNFLDCIQAVMENNMQDQANLVRCSIGGNPRGAR